MKQTFLRTMQVLHLALTIGASFFLITALAMVAIQGKGVWDTTPSDLTLILYIISYGVALLSSAVGIIVFERNMKDARNFVFLKDKVGIFRSAFIIRMALHEAPAFLCTIFYMLTGDYYFLPAIGISLLAIIAARPTADFVGYKLYLNEREKQELFTY